MSRIFDDTGQPIGKAYRPGNTYPEGYSIMPFFPGYIYDGGKSIYRGEEVGEGGYVYAEPGMYGHVATLDVASMHPSSIVAETLFGEEYTVRFKDILEARIAIKHGEYDRARKMLGGALAPYLRDEGSAKDLSAALKIAINSVYGLTAAAFDNPFRDLRNRDNIVAKRGALFMVNLRHEVQKRGYKVAHIKTDSIKIPDATPDIIRFVMDYGMEYGYTFEHECTYDRMCLVNDAVYIAKYASVETCQALYGYIPGDNKKQTGVWTATGTQFAVPYVFKRLFSREDILFDDLCETKAVSSALYLDRREGLPDVQKLEAERAKLLKKDPDASLEALDAEIAAGHDYRFVGKVGRFCPMVPGCGGGELMRETKTKRGEIGCASAAGCKGYLWMEAETVEQLGLADKINRAYYDRLVDDAVKSLSEHGDFEWFVSDDPYIPVEHPEDRPPWEH